MIFGLLAWALAEPPHCAVAASMPLNFLGNKLWSFRSEREGAAILAP